MRSSGEAVGSGPQAPKALSRNPRAAGWRSRTGVPPHVRAVASGQGLSRKPNRATESPRESTPLDATPFDGYGDCTVQRRAFTRQELMFLVGVPLAWAVLLLFHPGGDPDRIYLELQDKVTRWLVVHIAMMLFIPL